MYMHSVGGDNSVMTPTKLALDSNSEASEEAEEPETSPGREWETPEDPCRADAPHPSAAELASAGTSRTDLNLRKNCLETPALTLEKNTNSYQCQARALSPEAALHAIQCGLPGPPNHQQGMWGR